MESSKIKKSPIDLDRRYEELPFDEKSLEELATRQSIANLWAQQAGKPLSYYLDEPLLVVLGEARSGKTSEFRLIVQKLKTEGHSAFFVRLEDLAVLNGVTPLEGLRNAIELDDLKEFDVWLSSDQIASFFLDAVDEAKLDGIKQYRAAIKNFESALGNNLSRVKLGLSCRTTEWRGKDDVDVLRKILPKLAPTKKLTQEQRQLRPFSFLQILPLDLPRILLLAKNNDLKEQDAFLTAIQLTKASDYAGRPGDVIGIVSLWNEKKKLGSLTEIIEADILRKTEESNDAYRKHSLSKEKVREGLEALAAASVLCHQPNFRFSTVEQDTQDTLPALNPFSLLPNWEPKDVEALMRCAIFDEATYGRVRIHTRTTKEYLAAQWLIRRADEGCSSSEVVNILFANRYGLKTIIPTYANVAAWIAPKIRELFDALSKNNPESLVDGGDPTALTLEQKKDVIAAFLERYRGVGRTSFHFDEHGLRRFADAGLAEQVNLYLVDDTTPEHFREVLLDIVKLGQLRECHKICEILLLDNKQPANIRIRALRVLEACGCTNSLKQFNLQMRDAGKIPDRLYAQGVHALYPKIISSLELVQLLKLAPSKVNGSQYHTRDWLSMVLQEEKRKENLALLIQELTALHISGEADETEDGQQSDSFKSIYCLICICLTNWIKAGYKIEPYIFDALCLVEKERETGELIRNKISRDDLKEAIQKASREIRESLFNLKYEAVGDRDPKHMRTHYVGGWYYSVLHFQESDIDWMINIVEQTEDDQKAFDVFNEALSLSRHESPPYRRLDDLRKIASRSDAHKKLLEGHLAPREKSVWDLQHELAIAHNELKRKKYCLDLREKCVMDIKSNGILSESNVLQLIRSMWPDCIKENGEESLKLFDEMEILYGKEVIAVLKISLMEFWMDWQSNTKTQTMNFCDYAAWLGIHLSIANGLDISTLSNNHILIMLRSALKNFGVTPAFFQELVARHPSVVKSFFVQELETFSGWKLKDNNHPAILSFIRYDKAGLPELLSEDIVRIARENQPLAPQIASYVVDILDKAAEVNALITMAQYHLKKSGNDDELFWLAILLQRNAEQGMDYIKRRMSSLDQKEQSKFILFLSATLSPYRREQSSLSGQPDYLRMPHLEGLIEIVSQSLPRMHRERHGSYTPDEYDDAENFEGSLVKALSEISGKEAYDALVRLSDKMPNQNLKDYFTEQAVKRVAEDASSPWTETDIVHFQKKHECEPKNTHDLFDIVIKRLQEIKDSIEGGDNSHRDLFKLDTLEKPYQSYIAQRLHELARGRYSEVREPRVDDDKEPDILILKPDIGSVPIEIKRAHEHSVSKHENFISGQLAQRYLKPQDRHLGIYLLVNNTSGSRVWKVNGEKLDFINLCKHLQDRADNISKNDNAIEKITVIGIDFSPTPKRK